MQKLKIPELKKMKRRKNPIKTVSGFLPRRTSTIDKPVFTILDAVIQIKDSVGNASEIESSMDKWCIENLPNKFVIGAVC